MWYREQLGAIVKHLRAAGADLAQAIKPRWPTGDDTPAGVQSEIERAAAKFGNVELTARRLTAIGDRLSLVRRGLAQVDERLIAAIKRSIGVDVSPFFDLKGPIAGALHDAATENVSLIKSLPVEYFADIRAKVLAGGASGARWETIAKHIAEAGDHAANRVKMIARDQTSKLNAKFNEVRQQQVGIDEYVWSGAMDRRERLSHRAMEGSIQRWDAPPEVDGERVHPGQPILCRCAAIPHFHLVEDHGAEAAA